MKYLWLFLEGNCVILSCLAYFPGVQVFDITITYLLPTNRTLLDCLNLWLSKSLMTALTILDPWNDISFPAKQRKAIMLHFLNQDEVFNWRHGHTKSKTKLSIKRYFLVK